MKAEQWTCKTWSEFTPYDIKALAQIHLVVQIIQAEKIMRLAKANEGLHREVMNENEYL